MPRLGGDIPYRLMGAGQPTQGCTRDLTIIANPQSQDYHCSSILFNGVDDSASLSSDTDIGLGNAWSTMVWVAPSDFSPASNQTFFHIHESDAGDDSNSGSVYVKQDPEFWNKLAELANGDAEGLARVLGIDAQQVASWHNRIKQAAQEAEQGTAEKQQTKMLPTGVDDGQ